MGLIPHIFIYIKLQLAKKDNQKRRMNTKRQWKRYAKLTFVTNAENTLETRIGPLVLGTTGHTLVLNATNQYPIYFTRTLHSLIFISIKYFFYLHWFCCIWDKTNCSRNEWEKKEMSWNLFTGLISHNNISQFSFLIVNKICYIQHTGNITRYTIYQ